MFKKKLLLSAASVVALIAPTAIEKAQAEEATAWTARSVDEVKQDIVIENGEAVYEIQAGDTLSVIAEALEIDLDILEEIDALTNAELMVPDVELTAIYNEAEEVETIEVESTDGEVAAFDISAGYAVEITAGAPVAQTTATAEPVVEPVVEVEPVATEVASVVTPVEEWVVEDTVVETTEVAAEDWTTEEVATETYEAETYASEPAAETYTEVASPELAVAAQAVEAPATEEVVESTPVATEETVVTTTEEVVPVEGIPATEEIVEDTAPVENVTVEEIPAEDLTDVDTDYEVTEEEVSEEYVPEEPVYEEPVYEEPVYEEPVEEPVYEEPVYEEPVEEPVYEEPVYEEAADYDPYANPGNAGLTEDAASYKDEVAAQYGVTDFSTVRPGDPGDHGTGNAVDFMVYDDAALGDEIAQYSIDTMAENNISYVIWQQQIYGDWNQEWTWMEDRGSDTANHYDHVHVSFN